MIMKVACLLFCVLGLAQSASLPKQPFQNLERYSVSGILSLPYAEIAEPFRSWYDVVQGASRIDYYDGTVTTIQIAPKKLGEYGVGVKINPYTTEEVTNAKGCFWANGTSDAPVTIQSIIPDTTGFAFIGESTWKGKSVDQWQQINVVGDKKNTYTLNIDVKTGFPLYYEMIGYDSLLGSHYDRYYIEYFNWDEKSEIDASVFAINTPTQGGCRDFPGPGLKHRTLANPMHEFIHNDDSHVSHAFSKFQKDHSKSYDSSMEHKKRTHLFRHNLRYITSMNRKGKSYTLAINHLADRSDEELKVLSGKLKTKKNAAPNSGKPFDMRKYAKSSPLPASFDWRIFGAVSPVKDQGVCGSCWSFGTVGALEGAVFMKHKKLVQLSEQNLVDCSWGFGNNGCDGGEDFRAYDWIIKHGGIALESSYGPYKQIDGYCHYDEAKIGAKMNSYVNVTTNDQTALKTALVNNGPISIAIDAGHKSMIFYANGVYYEPDCANTADGLDHAVLLVGYGTMHGQDYWLVKNSWSTNWGNDGYILMSARDNNCGVECSPTFPIVE